MEERDRMTFEITGEDFKNLKRFCKQHEGCRSGMSGERLKYCFIPTGLGTAISVECSCGRKLMLGDFMDSEHERYDALKNGVVTEEERRNRAFEDAAMQILQLRDPRIFRIAFRMDQTFELLYVYAVGIARFADERIRKCLLWESSVGEYGTEIFNYDGLSDGEKISAFYDHFMKYLKEELRKYDCKNELLLRKLDMSCSGLYHRSEANISKKEHCSEGLDGKLPKSGLPYRSYPIGDMRFPSCKVMLESNRRLVKKLIYELVSEGTLSLKAAAYELEMTPEDICEEMESHGYNVPKAGLNETLR